MPFSPPFCSWWPLASSSVWMPFSMCSPCFPSEWFWPFYDSSLCLAVASGKPHYRCQRCKSKLKNLYLSFADFNCKIYFYLIFDWLKALIKTRFPWAREKTCPVQFLKKANLLKTLVLALLLFWLNWIKFCRMRYGCCNETFIPSAC